MPAYHTVVAEFPADLLAATDRYFRRRPWRSDWLDKAQEWLAAASSVYGIPTPRLAHTGPAAASGSGCYISTSNEIRMPHASVVTLFHEFRHALQRQLADEPRYRLDRSASWYEDDARAWSLSLFHQVRPARLAEAVAAGRVFYITPEDLT